MDIYVCYEDNPLTELQVEQFSCGDAVVAAALLIEDVANNAAALVSFDLPDIDGDGN